MGRRGGTVALVLMLCLVSAGCRGVSVRKARRGPSVAGTRKSDRLPVPDAIRPAPAFSEGPPLSPGAATLTGRVKGDLGPDGRVARAGASYRAGLAAEKASREMASGYYLDALVDAAEAIPALPPNRDGRPRDPRLAEARAVYRAALEKFLRLSGGRRVRLDEEWTTGLAARGVRMTVRYDETVWPSERFDEFLFPDDFTVRGVEPHYRTEGIGVPLIALRRFRLKDLDERRGSEKFLMPRQVYAVTAVLRVIPPPVDRPGAVAEFRLELHDPLRVQRVQFAGRSEPLATDLTTPLAYHFGRGPLPVLAEIGLLDPQRLEKLSGLYMLHPYIPDKIPVVLVHGLRSSPQAWMKVINELRGDPVLRDRYQIWLFMYPTGAAFPYSAAKLRQGLESLRQAIDPRRADRALDQTVLIGHSMGGLISKMMVQASGDALWRLFGTRPLESLQLSADRRDLLKGAFFFEPAPSVRRVVFIATPHRGSDLTDQFIGRLADRLIRLPNPLRATYRAILAQNGPDFFTPEMRAGLPSSIDELRRDNPLLMTLARLPIRPGVECHSIIGRKTEDEPLRESTDGIVPYVSSHIDWAVSERVVAGGHSCQDLPETVRELRRILTAHAQQVARESRARLDPSVRRARPTREGGQERRVPP